MYDKESSTEAVSEQAMANTITDKEPQSGVLTTQPGYNSDAQA